MSETRDALSDLVKSPGWALYVEHCQTEWGNKGTRYDAEMDKALNQTDPAVAHAQALQVRAARKIVDNLLDWPRQEISRLRQIEEPVGEYPDFQRGGY